MLKHNPHRMAYPSINVERLLQATFVARVESHQTLGSTNDRARQCAAEGGQLPLLVVAETQTSGRGRGGNSWWTGPGSLAFTLLLDVGDLRIDRRDSPLVALAVAVAVAEMAAGRLPDRRVGIHWPNDVFVDDRKLAGILVETLSSRLYVIGVGINTNSTLADAPEELRPRVATLRELTGQTHDPTDVLVAVLEGLARLLLRLATSPETVAARADALCLQRGHPLVLDTGRGQIGGRCAGIGPDGGLLLDTSDGRRVCYTGVLR
jgi:BirA family biotin operon repressor/biotin-[acetyl-CoA-carboxylase] ligase